MAQNPDEIRRAAEIDRLLASANLHRMRGDYVQAEEVFRHALALDESRADIRELVADMLYARAQLDAAADEYKRVLESSSERVSAETKYAKVVLEIGEREHEKQIALEMLENPKKFSTPPRHPLLAFILSGVVPGLGQMYNQEILKGAIILGVFVLALLVLAISPGETKNLLLGFGVIVNPAGVEGRPPPAGVLVILSAIVLIFVYIYAVIDAPIAAAKSTTPERKAAEPEA